MPKTTRPMPPVEGAVPGAIATLRMPIGLTYHSLIGTMGGTDFNLSHITEFRLKGNGRTIFTDSGANLDTHNMYLGRSGASLTQFILDFERYGLDRAGGQTASEALQGRELTAIGTNNFEKPADGPVELTTLNLEMDISSAAVAPFLSFKAHQSDPRRLGLLLKRRKFTFQPSASGEYEITTLPLGDPMDKIFIHSANDTIERVRIERDNFLAFDRTPDENNLVQIDGKRVPQSNLFVIDPSERGRGDEMIVTAGVADFRLKLDLSGSDVLTVYVDYLGSISGN